MDLLKEYDFDCLPLIDREFDNPVMQSAVHAVIAAEMRSFNPQDYLAYLPYPKLSFANSPALQAEMQRLETAPSSSSDKLNMDRYNAEKPGKDDEQDEQAWRSAVENIKAQLEHQENRLMNAELAETHLGKVWLQNNHAVEQIAKGYVAQTEAINRQIREINKARQVLQTKAYPELSKLAYKRDLALQRTWQCQAAHEQLRQDLLARGIDAEQVLAERRAQALAAMEADANDAAHNSTVREYEAVHARSEDGDGTEEGEAKRPRKE